MPLGAAHKPGAIPLRPLGLGDLYDGAFKIIRFNPAATVGSSVIVTGVAMLLPVVVTAALTWSVGLSSSALEDSPESVEMSELLGALAAYGALFIGSVLQWLGMILVTGMNAHVAMAAATGRRIGLGEAWAATHGKRWRLVGLTLLLSLAWAAALALAVGLIVLAAYTLDTGPAVLVGLALGATFVLVSVFLWVRIYYLAVPPLMLEPVGVFGALGRAWRLSRRQFWRIFGIGLLTVIVAGIAGQLVATPVSLVGQLLLTVDPGGLGVFWFMVANALAAVVSAALVSPFVASVTSLMYLDQRIRKEAFDVELLARAGITTP